MPSIFLSHTSVDKPFVEKLAHDLKRVGVNVWFDKWEIKVGDSLTWKIEQGIRESEFLGIVLSPYALQSEWVRSELGAAWAKQMQAKHVAVLPILLADCEVPLFLSDRRYADFRADYQNGFREIAAIFGIKETQTLSAQNWRRFVGIKGTAWREFRLQEFEQLVTKLIDRAREYNWSAKVGATKNTYSINFRAHKDLHAKQTVSIKLDAKTRSYKASSEDEWNPNNLKSTDFNTYVGNSVDECEEYIWRIMEDFKSKNGNPLGQASYSVHKWSSDEKTIQIIKRMIREMSWYKGEDLL